MIIIAKYFRQIFFVLGVASLAVAGLMGPVSAKDTATSEAANALKISPIRTDVFADPGETKVIKVVVTNTTDREISVKPVQNDFVAGDEDGSPAIILEENEYAPTHSLKRFMKPLENFTMAAGESKAVEMEIAVPEKAEAGGYFGSLRFAPVDPDSGGQVNLNMSLASLVLLKVNGDTPEKLEMTDFLIEQSGRPVTFLTKSDGVKVNVRFKNDSKVHLSPFGKISVTKGKTLVYDTDFNNKDHKDYILPSSARRWEIPLEKIDGFGRYTVSATFTYGVSNKTIEVTKSFWVVPLPMIIGGIVALVLIVTIIGFVIYKKRSKNSLSI